MTMAGLPMVREVFSLIERYGLGNALHFAWVKLVNLVLPLKILRGVHIEKVDPVFAACPSAYTGSFLSSRELLAFASDPKYELSRAFVEEALRHGDECYAICNGGNLAAYGWYSTHPTAIDPSDLTLHFAEGYVYMYKGFTDREYRGQRLHAIGMTCALQHYLDGGYKGIVSYVESTNVDSLKSCFRMGYSVFGSIYFVRLFGRYLIYSSPGCEAYEFYLRVVTLLL